MEDTDALAQPCPADAENDIADMFAAVTLNDLRSRVLVDVDGETTFQFYDDPWVPRFTVPAVGTSFRGIENSPVSKNTELPPMEKLLETFLEPRDRKSVV